MNSVSSIDIVDQKDVGRLRARCRLVASLAGLPKHQIRDLGQAVMTVGQRVLDEVGPTCAEIAFGMQDAAPHLDVVFDGAPARMGIALPHAEARIVVHDGKLIVCIPLPDGAELPTAATLDEWRDVLKINSTQGALVNSQRRLQQLRTSLESTQSRGLGLEQEISQLQDVNDMLRTLSHVANRTEDAIVILDKEKRIEWTNDSHAAMLNIDRSLIRGQTLTAWLAQAKIASEGAAQIQHAVEAGHDLQGEFDLESGRCLALRVKSVKDEHGMVAKSIFIIADLTTQRQVEQTLLQAKDAADEANTLKSEFLANMSHEIRTPMNAIIGLTQLTLESSLTSEQHEYLTTVKHSAESLLRLLNDVLDLSKIEARRLAMDPIPFRLSELIHDTVRPFLLQAKTKGLKLSVDIAHDVPENIVADPTRLQQVLTNLISNAIKFTTEGNVHITARVMERADSEARLRFQVIDEGLGIEPGVLPRLFDQFVQADPSISRSHGGTGLGLAISKQLAELMGGELSATSELGVGSTFTFDFPCCMTSGTDELPAVQPEVSLQPTRQLHLLVADDNPANRMLATRILEKRGHQTTAVASGREVLAAEETTSFDAILMDVEMPELDGLNCAREIRQREADAISERRIPIVAITAYAMKGDRERCLAAGMDVYLSKPIRAQELIDAVESLATGQVPLADDLSSPPAHVTYARFAQALDRLEGDEEIFREQIDYFLRDSPALLTAIRRGVDAVNNHELRIAAHRLKGLAASFDAEDVVALSSELEEAAKQHNVPYTEPLVDKLSLAMVDLVDSLQQWLDKGV